MKKLTSRFGVVLGSASIDNTNWWVSSQSGQKAYTYIVGYQNGVHIANSHLIFSLKLGDLVLLERSFPYTGLTIVARMFGDPQIGTPYQGTGGIMAPHDIPGAGTLGTAPVFTSGWFELDTGPGYDTGALHP